MASICLLYIYSSICHHTVCSLGRAFFFMAHNVHVWTLQVNLEKAVLLYRRLWNILLVTITL
jgi:hypothetical protein